MAGAQSILATPLTNPQLEVIRRALPRLLGDLDLATFEAIRPHLQWESVELAGGEMLFREGDPSDALYLLISGRLQAMVAGPGGLGQVVGEIGRGESVGEMGLFSGKPRRATVMALRDSVLARIELAAFHKIIKAVPALALNLSRVIIERLQRRNTSHKPVRNVTNIAVVSVGAGLAPRTVLGPLFPELEKERQTVLHLTSESIDAAAGRAGAAQVTDDDPTAHHWLVNYLDELEGRYSLVFYEADPTPTEWTRRCLRQADEVLWLATASDSAGAFGDRAGLYERPGDARAADAGACCIPRTPNGPKERRAFWRSVPTCNGTIMCAPGGVGMSRGWRVS